MINLGEMVRVQVVSALPFGLFCLILKDQTQGYIRRRELSLEGTIDPRILVKPGDCLDVVVLRLATDDKIIELSRRRALPDPWVDFGQKTKVWDTVRGTVKYLLKDRVIVEVLPGVDGTISLENLSTTRIQRPEEIVWQGDLLNATVLKIEPSARKLQLSIRHQLERQSLISDLLGQINQHENPIAESQVTPDDEKMESRPPLQYNGQILLAEDDADVRSALKQWLGTLGCQVTACANGSEALEYIQKEAYSLLFTDVNMPLIDGVSLVRQIKRISPKTVSVFISDPENISQHLLEIESLGGYIITKPLDTEEIYQFLEDMSSGIMPPQVTSSSEVSSSQFHSFEKKVVGMRAATPLDERLEAVLSHLLEETGAEKAILFHYDPISRLINIVAQVGHLPLDETQVHYLVASPVEDVITEDIVIWENHLSSGTNERFENLLRLLSFNACIGLPVHTGEDRNYALFIFHRQPETFNRYRVRDVQTTASLVSVALEEDLFRNHVRESSTIILNGQLSAAFNHEVYNKISVLDLQLDTLTSSYQSLLGTCSQIQSMPQVEQVNKALAEVAQAVRAINRMAEDFRQIMRSGSSQRININQLIIQACEQMKPVAIKNNISITPELDVNLPDLLMNRFALIYVVYNLLLNAVQHLENRPGDRLVRIQTGRIDKNGNGNVFIQVTDNGPGIHRQLWEKIFELGFTTREGGSGLGLYIARSLVETLGGKIYVEKSFIHTGTTFQIEIPGEADT